jgi:hypothetical protein
MIQLIMLPLQAPVTWEKFVEMEDKFAIALDGYVIGEPRFDPVRMVANFNHHENVNRLATRATCAQVLMALRQGLFKTFRNEKGPYATVLANDCDEDVCTSWYLLKHHAVCSQPMNPLLNRLVMMEDALDATAGAYPFPADLPILRELAWVFEPYRQFRLSGQLDKKDAQAYRSIVEDVESRIGRHITGTGQEIPLDTRYERIGGGKGWVMVKELGAQARTGMFSDGIQAYVSVRELGHARWAYVVGRLSNFIPFDCKRIFDLCNEVEKGGEDRWGGSDMIGGSPRVGASKIPPTIVEKLINEALS